MVKTRIERPIFSNIFMRLKNDQGGTVENNIVKTKKKNYELIGKNIIQSIERNLKRKPI